MAGYGYLHEALNKKTKSSTTDMFTIGLVVDTNDPQQMGRVRAFCPVYGDKDGYKLENIPWSMYVAPFGGMTNSGTRGAEQSPTASPVAYGMWNIPKIGAYVLVGCIDGDKNFRFYSGCIQPQYMTHTMPHGRFIWSDDIGGTPDGPLDTEENPIQPLYDSLTAQFQKGEGQYAVDTPEDPRANMEWRSRGTDYQCSAITNLHVEHPDDGPGSAVADHSWGDFSFTTITEEDGSERVVRGPGYGVDQQQPDLNYGTTSGVNYDSLTYSWTTPGFHSISMDDRHENSRVRIRTTSGHQIIMDDTNERIYINTAGGESWIELDKVGNIDIYASKNISAHAGGDMSLVAGKTLRLQGKEGIHVVSDNEVRVHAKGGNGLNLKSNTEVRLESVTNAHIKVGGTLFLESTSEMNITSGTNMFISQGGTLDIDTTGVGAWTTGDEMHHLASGTMFFTASPDIHLNGPAATAAVSASSADIAKESFIAARIPEHEPWARIFSDPAEADKEIGNIFKAKPLSYNDQSVGKEDRDGAELGRNPLWHR